jgi:4-alpha-glucanotransferase
LGAGPCDDGSPARAHGARADDADDIRYHAFLQWLAAAGLAEAQRRAREAGMSIGLIADLAVGSDPAGSDAWALREEMLGDATIGAPPDFFNANGQGWGLTALSPLAMRAHGYQSFIEILRATMRHGGGVRIDHAMNLMRIWIVPRGAAPLDGAYLRYPLDDLLRLLALESWRHRCIVIGEDLGVVPEGFRERMRRARLLGTDVLFFMRRERFLPPRRWRRHAVAMTTTHDLPTLAGWWRGLDIDLRERIGLHSRDLAAEERERRADDRALLAQAINAAGTPKRVLAASSADAFVDAAIGFVGATRSELALVPVEDVLALERQQNVPGTVDEHPNWRQRLAEPAPRALATADAKRRLHVLAEARSRP